MGVALLALIIAASGAVVAAIPSSDGTITACRDSKSGAIRVINAASQTCTSKETQLRWKDGSTLLGKNEKAADSDKLDGLNSTDFIKGSGAVISNEGPFINPSHHWLFDPSQEQQLGFNLNYYCPGNSNGEGQLDFYNMSTSNTVHLLWDDGSANPFYTTVTPQDEVYWWITNPTGEHIT